VGEIFPVRYLANALLVAYKPATQVAGDRISTSVYYVPGIIAPGVIAAWLRQSGGLG
jgi:hypothetical protein